MTPFPSNLSLDCELFDRSSPIHALNDRKQNPQQERIQKLEEFLARVEEERVKIEAFKRELPICMQLLTNAIETSREQLHVVVPNECLLPPLEKYNPEATYNDKANWMMAAKLWIQDGNLGRNVEMESESNSRNDGGLIPLAKEMDQEKALSDLALEGRKWKEPEKDPFKFPCGNEEVVLEKEKSGISTCHRKARRSWSPELHRRFVSALEMLGGSQVATPKQIREVMKVDGLTNDEVKSHLQKYRLHTRRPGPTPHATSTPTPHLVVLGGIWVPTDYAPATNIGAPSVFTALATTPSPYFGTSLDLVTPIHNPPMEGTKVPIHGSPRRNRRACSENSNDMGDGKSGGNSWKGEGGVKNRSGSKGLVAPKDDGKSRACETTLKF